MENPDLILNSLGGLSYGGVFLIALAANFIIPVPEELVLLAIGYLTSVGVFMYPAVMAIFILGMLVSDYVLYSLSFHGSKFVKRLREKMIRKGFLKNERYVKDNINKIIKGSISFELFIIWCKNVFYFRFIYSRQFYK
jgi:membrane protein DedA with SNARE-associated domain